MTDVQSILKVDIHKFAVSEGPFVCGIVQMWTQGIHGLVVGLDLSDPTF